MSGTLSDDASGSHGLVRTGGAEGEQIEEGYALGTGREKKVSSKGTSGRAGESRGKGAGLIY